MSADVTITPIQGIIIASIVGPLGGALNSFARWLASNDSFIPRKFASAVIQGALAAIPVTATAIAIFRNGPVADVDFALILMGLIAEGLGFQQLFNNAGTAVANRVFGQEPTPTTTPTQ